MASISVIEGRAGSGKSRELYRGICRRMDAGERCLLLVPAQYSYEAELRLCEMHGGVLGAQVYYPERLLERVLIDTDYGKPVMSAQGRRMVLKRVILKCKSKLILFGRIAESRGFAESMDELIGRFRRQSVSCDELEACANALDEGSMLARKLRDIALLYREGDRYMDEQSFAADLYEAAMPRIADSFVKSCHVYIDGIEYGGKQKLEFITRLASSAESLTVALRSGGEGAADGRMFRPDAEVKERLMETASLLGIPFYTQFMQGKPKMPEALAYLESHLYLPPDSRFLPVQSNVVIEDYPDRNAEIAAVGDQILELARRGVRYRDIAVLATDLDAYGFGLKRAFEKRSIPLFSDFVRPVKNHAAAELMTRAVGCCASGFSPKEVLRLAKSGYTGCDAGELEIFENYILRMGLFGSDMAKPFERGEVPKEAERVRCGVMGPLMRLKEGMSQESAALKVRALYEYLCELDLSGQLKAQAQKQLAIGRVSEAEQYAQLWNIIMELLTQLHDILGENKLGVRAFLGVLEEGIAGYSMGVLPGTADQVILGDLYRTRSGSVDTLFILGCNEGLLPRTHNDDELICDAELELMKRQGISVWENTELCSANDRLELYSTLSKARHRVIFSYAYSDGGAALSPSSVIGTLFEHFVNMRRESVSGLPSCKAAGFERMVDLLRAQRTENVQSPELDALKEYFGGDETYAETLDRILQRREERLSPEPFGSELATAMYGTRPSMSASRLEQFGGCPFSQYLAYGLSARERREFTENPADAGTFLHDALDAFVKEVLRSNTHWCDIGESEVESILDTVLPPVIAEHNNGILINDVRQHEALFLRLRQLKRACLSIVEQTNAGSFTPMAGEYSFGRGGEKPLTLKLDNGRRVDLYGRIDRIDMAPGGVFRIVDYKMGGRSFDPTGLWYGQTLQLPLYLAAARRFGEGTGMYYMSLTPKANRDAEDPDILPLSGLTASDDESVNAAQSRLDGSSLVITGLKRKKDGSISGSTLRRKELNDVVDAAIHTAETAASEIFRGEAAISPTEKACEYCPYSAVCRFDEQLEGCKVRHFEKLKLDELIALAGGEK